MLNNINNIVFLNSFNYIIYNNKYNNIKYNNNIIINIIILYIIIN